ncbi:MAG: UPF0175 family protein [Ardenticatenia bacterium]|nr:MAG: UPF0175 family protein [Ardenticatenia bacterium]
MDTDRIFLEIPRDILETSHLTKQDLLLELALALYAQNKLSAGKASELAHVSLWEFRRHLANRRIPVHYSVEDLNQDVETLHELGFDE